MEVGMHRPVTATDGSCVCLKPCTLHHKVFLSAVQVIHRSALSEVVDARIRLANEHFQLQQAEQQMLKQEIAQLAAQMQQQQQQQQK